MLEKILATTFVLLLLVIGLFLIIAFVIKTLTCRDILSDFLRLFITPKEEDKAEQLEDYRGKYKAKNLLTGHEANFYKDLKKVADKLGLSITAKIRMADLVEPTANQYKENKEYFRYFGKIKSKHVDFALCDPETFGIKLLIELDDRSHESAKVIKRDEFVETVYKNTGYTLLRVNNNWYLESKIKEALGIPEDKTKETP